MSILIFANGDISTTDWIWPYVEKSTALIAADGGARHLLNMGLTPDVIVGDVDSLSTINYEQLVAEGTKPILGHVEKNETDLEMALNYSVQTYDVEIFVFGWSGGRLDQTISNMLMLAHPVLNGSRITLADAHQKVWFVDDATVVEGSVGDTLSLIPVGGDAHVRMSEGLKWPLINDRLLFGYSRGVSNTMTSARATLEGVGGKILCIHTNQDWHR